MTKKTNLKVIPSLPLGRNENRNSKKNGKEKMRMEN